MLDSPLTIALILLGTRSNQGTVTPSVVSYMYAKEGEIITMM
jgi:hypothetical protein